MDQKNFAKGDVIFKEGEVGDSAFLVASGRVEITRVQNGTAAVIGEIKAGQIFGEMALINDKPRTATARAAEPSVCYLVPQLVFQNELNGSSALMRAMVLNLISHIRSLMVQMDAAGKPAQPGVVFHKPTNFKNYSTD